MTVPRSWGNDSVLSDGGFDWQSRTPVVFMHGLWLLPSSWDRWETVFEEDGLVAPHPGLAR